MLRQAQALEALRSATQLDYLCCMEDPRYNQQPDTQEHWRAFFQFVASHPPLSCLGLEGCYDAHVHVSPQLIDSIIHLAHVRPGLRVRRPTAHSPLTFMHEVLHCPDIPPDSGTGFSGFPPPYNPLIYL